MNNLLKTKPGSALLIALFLMATLGAISFGTSRTYISEIRSTTNLTATTGAYYAAEGALESALLDYRKDKDIEIKDALGNALELPKVDGTDSIMKRKVSYLANAYKCTDTGPVCPVDSDEVISFIIPANKTVTLNWDWVTGSNGYIRYTKTSADGTYNHGEGKVIDNTTAISQSSINITAFSTPTIIRFRPMGASLAHYFVNNLPANTLVDSGETTIDAKGQYKATSRQLQAKIDRSSGRLLGIFDYTLLSQSNLPFVTPPTTP